MNHKSILMSCPMVRSMLDGRKSVTRRIIKLPEIAREIKYWTTPTGRPEKGYADPGVNYWTESGNHIDPCPHGYKGDLLYVRETFRFDDFAPDDLNRIIYFADMPDDVYRDTKGIIKWKPSIFLPKAASRLTLKITGIKVEQLHCITTEDIIREGLSTTLRGHDACCDLNDQWIQLWNSINGKKYPWKSNPWVWVICFDVIHKNILEILNNILPA